MRSVRDFQASMFAYWAIRWVRHVEHRAKARNRKLSKLNLENNRFTEIPTRAFRQAQTITSLKIGSNPLQSLDSWGFTTLNVLTELDIRNLTQLSVIKVNSLTYSTMLNPNKEIPKISEFLKLRNSVHLFGVSIMIWSVLFSIEA